MVNFERPRIKIERFMLDQVVVTRDVSAVYDDVLNETTGVLTPPSPDSVSVYEGKALILSTGIGQAEGAEGRPVELQGIRAYRGIFPVAVTDLEVNDIVKVTLAYRDPLIDQKSFRITGVHTETVGILREVDMEADR